MPSCVGERDLERDLVADRGDREARPVRAGRRARPDDGPVVPWHPPSTFGHTTKKRSVSIGAPGPMVPSHQPTSPWPGSGGPGGVAVAGERVQHEHRVRRVGRERAPRLVGDGHRLERAAGLELQAVGERDELPAPGLVARRATRR